MTTGRKRWKKVLAGVAVFFTIALAFLGWKLHPFFFPKKFDVVSIKTTGEYQNPALLEQAWALPVAAAYRRGSLVYQPNPSLCGPTSVADVMRSLGTAGMTPERALEGTGYCSSGVCWGGITLDELADLARKKTRRQVTVVRDLTLAEFREHLARVNDPSRRYIVNFDRGPLFGTAGGHHSPIGGYLADRDLVLVLDVNAKYKPWLVPAERLFTAMDTVDGSSNRRRGLLLIE